MALVGGAVKRSTY